MRQAEATHVWSLFLAIFVLSAPLIVLGWRSGAMLLPGLPISALMVVSIAAAACLFAYSTAGLSGLGALLARTVDLEGASSPLWYVASTLLMPAVLLVEYGVMKAWGWPVPSYVSWIRALPLFALFVLAAALEEIAWTGIALEPLLAQWGALVAALVIGSVWALLHSVPYVQVQPLAWAAGQCIFSVLFRVVLVWLYVSTEGSVLAVVLCHAGYNTAWQLFPSDGSAYDPWIAAALTGLLALGLVLATGPQMFTRGT